MGRASEYALSQAFLVDDDPDTDASSMPLRLVSLCMTCGGVVFDVDAHDAWHARTAEVIA